MRTIKFRAWDGKQIRKAFDLTSNPKYWWKDNKDYLLMQYVGLKDKNDIEIYEDDIIRLTNSDHDTEYIGLIAFEGSSFVAKIKIGNQYIYVILKFEGEDDGELEIIGNIHENPELLKGL